MTDTPKKPESREAASRGVHANVFELLRAEMSHGRVLDVPCGSGAFARRLMDAGYVVAAADITPHPAVPQNVFHQADMNATLPFEDAGFDAVVSIEGIEHIQRPFDFIRECRRILKDGGLFILTTPNISSIRSRWRWFLTGFHNKSKYPLDEANPSPRHHIGMLSYPQARYTLHTGGFTIESVHTNRIKAANWLYLPAVPLVAAVSALALPKGAKNAEHRQQIAQIRRRLLSIPILFGETMILIARAER